MSNNTAIAERIKLSSLNTGMWRPTRLHKTETKAENERHKTDVAKVLIKLTDNENLKRVSQIHSAAYIEHKRITLPTVQDGMRMLPAGRELEHAQRMQDYRDQHDKAVAAFLAEYDHEKEIAPIRLNGLYDASMWPSHSRIADKFRFDTRYLACPSDGSWADWIEESSRAAHEELHDRIKSTLERVRDRCNSEGPLYATVFDSVRDLADLVPDLDFDGSFTPVVEAIKPLTGIHAENLRDDKGGREAAAERAASILSVLGGIK